MKTQRFGIEIEMTGITRRAAANIIADHFGTTESGSSNYEIRDNQGRTWKVVSDNSIRPQTKNGTRASDDHKVEMVSPICTYEDIATIQEIVRKLAKKKAMVNDSCGIHVHVDASTHTAQSLKNLTNIMASKESLLFKALQVRPGGESNYCKKVEKRFVEAINKMRMTDKETIKRLWYNDTESSHYHYHKSRYRALNLHSVWDKGTVEFRCYNSTLHAGEVKTYIQLSLAISHQAKAQKSASCKETSTTNDKYTFRTWLLRLGMIGDEYETARHHLLKKLTGDIAFRDNRRMAA